MVAAAASQGVYVCVWEDGGRRRKDGERVIYCLGPIGAYTISICVRGTPACERFRIRQSDAIAADLRKIRKMEILTTSSLNYSKEFSSSRRAKSGVVTAGNRCTMLEYQQNEAGNKTNKIEINILVPRASRNYQHGINFRIKLTKILNILFSFHFRKSQLLMSISLDIALFTCSTCLRL